jgi:hypothetical protein
MIVFMISDVHERAYEIAEEEERHARGFLEETSPADKATMTISEFCEQRFLRYHAVSPGTRFSARRSK